MVVWNGNGVPQLAVGLIVIIGRAVVPCPECGETRLWDVSVEALVEIFRHLDAGQVFECSKRLLSEENR